jgi:hypothetical protein
MRGGAAGATAIGLNPAGLPLTRELVFEGGYGYRDQDSASILGVSACDSTNAAPGCFFYDYVSASPSASGAEMTGSRTTHVAGLALARQLVPRVMVGATGKYFAFDTSIAGEAKARGFAFDVGGTARLTRLVNLGLAAQNLWASKETPEFPRAIGGGLLARPVPSLALGFDLRWKLDGDQRTARYGGGAELFLRSGSSLGFPLRAGGLRDRGLGKTYVSGGVGLAALRWGIDLTARLAVDGGDDALIIGSMRFFGPRMPAPILDGE